jgi:hypothetical protein
MTEGPGVPEWSEELKWVVEPSVGPPTSDTAVFRLAVTDASELSPPVREALERLVRVLQKQGGPPPEEPEVIGLQQDYLARSRGAACFLSRVITKFPDQ